MGEIRQPGPTPIIRRRPWPARAAAGVCAGALVLGAIEGFARLATGGACLLRYRPHSTLLWELAPSQRNVWMRGARGIAINVLGMRGPEAAPEAPPGTFRVAVVGDSASFGHGLPPGEAWPERLESVLRDKTGAASRFEVLNLAVPGYSTSQAVEALASKALPLHPALAILPTTFNEGWQMREGETRLVRERFLRGAGTKDLLKRSSAFTLAFSAAQEAAIRSRGALDLPPPGPLPPGFLETYAADLETALRLARDAGVPLVLATLPMRAQVGGEPGPPFVAERQRVMREVTARTGSPLADVARALVGEDPSALFLARDEVHPSAVGAGRIAALIAPVVENALTPPPAP